MIDSLPYYQVFLYVTLGVIAAGLLLFYIRKLPLRKKYHLLALCLFLAALVYVTFSLTTLNEVWITVEVVGLLLFLLFIWMAFHYSMWFVVLGWAAHIVWDVGIHPQETAPYVPYWYAWICVGFDAVIAGFIAVCLVRHEYE